jgi:hypothetical protein
MAVLGSGVLQPLAVIAHEVAETALVRVPSVLDEGGKAWLHGLDEIGVAMGVAMPAHGAAQQHGAGIVIDAIAVASVGNAENRMLKQARIVTHRRKMIERHRGQCWNRLATTARKASR